MAGEKSRRARPTIKDVALDANVSISTVSLVINDKGLAKDLEKRIAGRTPMNKTEAQSLLN